MKDEGGVLNTMRVSADRNGGSPPPNVSEGLKSKFSETTAEAQPATERAIQDKTITALELIGEAIRDLNNRIITLERRSSETNETFESLRSSVEELSQSLEHDRAIANTSVEKFDHRLTMVAKYAVALNQKIADLPTAVASKPDTAQIELSTQIDLLAGLISNLQGSVNDSIARIENLEKRITKLDQRETAISDAAMEEASDEVRSRSGNPIIHETEVRVDDVELRGPLETLPSANEHPEAGSAAVPAIEEAAGQITLGSDAEPSPAEPASDSASSVSLLDEQPPAPEAGSAAVPAIEEAAGQITLGSDAEPSPAEPASDSASYDAWNRALCEYFFSERSAGKPVYLDPEETALAEICRTQRWKLDDPKAVLVEAIRQTIDLTRSNPFAVHVRNAKFWNRGKKISDPPFVGVLAVFSIAAAAMVASEDHAAHNYYDRLCDLLHVVSPEDKHAIQTGYRDCAEELWQFLNAWLDDWDGDRGRPTARSLDRRRYVSLAISQALVREHDRLQLRKMFSFYDLAPGQAVGLLQMRQVLQHWFSSGHHISLARLWQRGEEFQDRISEIACAELNSWDGLSGDSQVDSSRPRAISVFAELRWHPVPSIDLSLVVPRLESESPRRFQLSDRTDNAGRAAVELTRGEVRLEPSGYDDLLILEPRERIRIGDALLASLDLAPEGGEGQHLIHSGQPLLTLAYSDRYGAFREVANPQLLERLVVLSHQTIRGRVAQHLQAAARPGFKEFDRSRLRGLPEGWVAFIDVEIVARIDSDGLEALMPVSDWQLLLSGGVGLGRDTWHHHAPPEIKAAASGVGELELVIETQNDSRQIKRFMNAATIPVSELELGDGNYSVALRRLGGNSRYLARAGLRIRSADTARPELTVAGNRLAYLTGEAAAWGTVSARHANIEQLASNLSNGVNAVVGPKCFGTPPPYQVGRSLTDIPARIDLEGDEIDDEMGPSANLETTTRLEGSCILRGHHYWRFETVPPDAHPDDLVRAHCTGCGKTFWRTVRLPRGQRRAQPASIMRPERAPSQPTLATVPDTIAAIAASGSLSVEVLLDALCYMRIGTWQTFQTLAAAVDDSPVYAVELARTLIALGHMDVELAKSTLRPMRWSISPTSLVPVNPTKTVVAGWRSRAILARVNELVISEGGVVRRESGALGVPIITIDGIPAETVRVIGELISSDTGVTIEFCPNAALTIATVAAPISMIGKALAPSSLPSQELEAFEIQSARWRETSSISKPGAYRTKTRGMTYLYVSQTDLSNRVGRVGDPRIVKHLAALDAQASLASYSIPERSLTVPLGCELPGILERAAVLCSGQPPIKLNGQRRYMGVLEDVARIIWARLRS
jgi:hypothetical protein